MIIDALSGFSTLTNPGGNYTNNGYPTRIPQSMPPTKTALSTGLQAIGDGVIACGAPDGNYAAGYVYLIPIGAGSSTNTFSMTVLGWDETKIQLPNCTGLWTPITMAVYAVTLGTATGVVNTDIPTTQLFNTTIAMTGAAVGVTSGMAATVLDWFTISPGSNAIGMIKQPTFGFRFLEVIFTTGGSATSCNCLYRKG